MSNLAQQEDEFENGVYYDFIKKDKTSWGVFQVKENSIIYETWVPSSGGPLETVVRSGHIIDDETFVITSILGEKPNKAYAILNDTFHYKQLLPKPDSTNRFIK